MINTLSPELHMSGHTLIARNPGQQREVHLRGTGLILMPSLFWTGHPRITWDPQDQSQHVLIYSARTAPTAVARPGARDADALGALMGAARAAVLRALHIPRTTSELAAYLGVSASSASQHATTLRNAGLVTSQRQGKSVHHRLTHLGATLLRQH
jgi:DNA-binding transcriptional ArsR family regulator